MKDYRASHKQSTDFGVIFREGEAEGSAVEITGIRIDGVIGSGANGIVFSATDSLDRELAVKVYPPRADRDRDSRELDEQAMSESQKIASLKHDGIATVYRYGRLGDDYHGWMSDGWPYCVMEYRPGRPLREVIGGLAHELESRRSILMRIFDILGYAEKHGSLHAGRRPQEDRKPSVQE